MSYNGNFMEVDQYDEDIHDGISDGELVSGNESTDKNNHDDTDDTDDLEFMRRVPITNKNKRAYGTICLIHIFLPMLVLFSAIISTLFVISLFIGDFQTKTKNPHIKLITSYLHGLYNIGLNNNGSRTAGTGYNASSDYILSKLNSDFYTVKKQYFDITELKEESPPLLKTQFKTYKRHDEYELLYGYYGSVSVTDALLYKAEKLGCDSSDFQNITKDSVALVKRGQCSFKDKANNAAYWGAKAIIVYNVDNNVTMGNSGNTTIPVFMVSLEVAHEWIVEQQFIKIDLNVNIHKYVYQTHNIIAYRRGFNDDSRVVIGSHLDSVQAGTGINDNGSGSTTILQIANTLATENGRSFYNSVMFCWWAGEELGLKGSAHYVKNLPKEELKKIAMNLNFDMLGSINGAVLVYDGKSAVDESIKSGSAYIQSILEQQFEHSILTPFDGRSDYGPFIENGIVAGGYFSGAEGLKTEEVRDMFGGSANVPYDSCYHKHCDTVFNIDLDLLGKMAIAVHNVTKYFVGLKNLRSYLQ